MQAVIRKWGNSPALRLPAAVLKQAGYRLEQQVELVVEQGRIIIQPSDKVSYELGALLEDIRPDNQHAEVSVGRPLGREAL